MNKSAETIAIEDAFLANNPVPPEMKKQIEETLLRDLEAKTGAKTDAVIMEAAVWGAIQVSQILRVGFENKEPIEKVFAVAGTMVATILSMQRSFTQFPPPPVSFGGVPPTAA